MPTIQNNYLDATLLETNEAVDLGKDALGLGFKENISEQIKAVQAMRMWQAYSKIAALRESTQQLDSIIASLQECIQKASDGGSAVIVSRLFTLKRQLSASPGYSAWVLRCIADVVDEKLGPVTEADLHRMCQEIELFASRNSPKARMASMSKFACGPADLQLNMRGQSSMKRQRWRSTKIASFHTLH